MSKRLKLSFCILALIMLGLVIAILAIGGRPDPTGPAIGLDGAWRFHPGDNPQWAGPQIDDRRWDRLDLVSVPSNHDDDVGLPGWLAGWRARGHPDLEGYGWYRKRVVLPAHGDLVLLGPTMVDDGYEMFWNGQPIGGIGKLGPDPKVIGARPFLVRLPGLADQRSGVLAIRTFMEPGLARNEISGGLRSVPTLATAAFGERLYRAQWMRTIAGYIAEIAIAVMMALLAGIALIVAPSTARPSFARWLALALVATACLRLGNAIAAWTDLLGASTLDRQNAVVFSPLAMLGWTAAWNEWTEGRDRAVILGCAIVAWASRVIGAIAHLAELIVAGRFVFIILFAIIASRIASRGEHKPLAIATMSVVAIGLFVGELSQLGVPTIWFPFNIGVSLSQYVYAISVLLLAFTLPRKAPSGSTSGQATTASRSIKAKSSGMD